MTFPESSGLIFIIIAVLLAALSACLILLPISPAYYFAILGSLLFLLMVHWISGFKETLLCLLAFIIPFNIGKFFMYPQEPNVWVGIELIDGIVIALYSVWAVEIFRNHPSFNFHKNRAVYISILFLLFFGIISYINAQFKILAVYNWWILFRGILIFFFIAHYPFKKGMIYALVVIFMVGVMIQGSIGIIQWIRGQPLGLKFLGEPLEFRVEKLSTQLIRRVTGTLPSQNMLWFMYMDFILPLLGSFFFLRTHLVLKAAAISVFAFGLLASSLTFARGGWISFIVSMCCLFGFNLMISRFSIKVVMKGILIIMISAVPLFFLGNLIIDRVGSYDYGSLEMRQPLMDIALTMIGAHPILGIGIGNYLPVMYLYDVSTQGITSFFIYPVHNLYLLVAAETGIFSLLSFLGFFFAVGRRAWNTIMGQGDRTIVVIMSGLLSGVIGFSVHGLVESMTLGRLIIFWFFCGLIISLAMPGEELKKA